MLCVGKASVAVDRTSGAEDRRELAVRRDARRHDRDFTLSVERPSHRRHGGAPAGDQVALLTDRAATLAFLPLGNPERNGVGSNEPLHADQRLPRDFTGVVGGKKVQRDCL